MESPRLVVAGDGSNRRFVVDQVGVIRVITADGTLLEEPFLDVRDRMVTLGSFFDERGLLGLASHPQYADNGRFFVYYSAPLRAGAPADFNHTSHVSEFRVSSDPNRGRSHLRADPAPGRPAAVQPQRRGPAARPRRPAVHRSR